MGYACPVCEIPQADARHLANHLAFTALLGRADHRAWLDEHAPGWESEGERELAERVESEAKAVEFPQVFEDTAGGLDGEHDHDHEPAAERSGALFDDEGEFDDEGDRPGGNPERTNADAAGGAPPRDEETQRILEEAREMTREMLRDEGGADDADGGDDPAADDAEDADDAGATERGADDEDAA